ncbi:MAG: T9SS type A sorting domain-containing protein [Ignavibacteria bacterium]
MIRKVLFTALVLFSNSFVVISSDHGNNQISSSSVMVSKNIFLQSGNINTVFRNDGYFNYDKVTFSFGAAGMIWPAGSSQRLSPVFTSGIWIGAKSVISGNQKELRLAASMYTTHYSPGNIPVNGQVPPLSVCNDSAFNGYLVSVTDQSLVNGGVRTKTAGGRTYTFNYSPWSAWPVNLGAPYVEVNGTPGYQPGWNADRPGIGFGTARPSEMIFVVFMDYTNCTNNIHISEPGLPGGTSPLGVEVQQLSYTFDVAGFMDSYFVRYKFINKSGLNWDSTYVSLVNDGDLGDPNDDAVGCDSSKNISYTYNFDNNDSEYGAAPPAVGYRLLQGPVIYTGINTDTAKLPCNTLIGYKMKMMSGHNRFLNGGDTCTSDPDNYIAAYNFMEGKNGCGHPIINPVTGLQTKYVFSGNPCNTSGWRDSVSSDKRNILNCGPFNMASGDTQIVVYSYSVSRGSTNIQSVCDLINLSNNINSYYYNCFNLIGIEPINNSIPEKFALLQNYPNPFNPETKINFSVPEKSFVEIKVYDALGRETAVLLNEEVNAGNYDVNFNASSYPSGIYFYRLSTGSFTETKKMVLVK